jgi:hypothetical protein
MIHSASQLISPKTEATGLYGIDIHQAPRLRICWATHPLISTSLSCVFHYGRKLSRPVHKITLLNAVRFRVPNGLNLIYFNTTVLPADILTWWLKETTVAKQQPVNNNYDAAFSMWSAPRLYNQIRQAAEGQCESQRGRKIGVAVMGWGSTFYLASCKTVISR